ncbi:MAG TPA: serine acetyltransferase [Clostridiales bacterium]|nr:serine acetyltransferase [Clostridiales bacterium]
MGNTEKSVVNECIEGLFDKSCQKLSKARIFDLPDKKEVERLLDDLKGLVYPFCFCSCLKTEACVEQAKSIKERLKRLIASAFSYLCEAQGEKNDCKKAIEKAEKISDEFLLKLPAVFEVFKKDVAATLAGDPAATDPDLIILTYPGIEATFTYRLAHILYKENVPLIPRMMTEIAHSKTGIDINPGAEIGESFVIDHGTGIVIGETTKIGERVNIYQGVTLGAISLKNARSLVGKKRHPTIEDDVTIYAGATILGGETVIGKGSVIGSSVFLTESVPEYTSVLLEKPALKLIPRKNK